MTTRKKARAKKRLGRGLGSIISMPVEVAPPEQAAAGSQAPARAEESADGQSDDLQLRHIEVKSIAVSPSQPRKHFEQASLESLAASIKANGLMQPIVVRPAAGGFQLIAGERRWRAAQMIGLEHLPAVVHDVDDPTSARWSLVENIQREDLNPIERAEAFEELAGRFGMTHQEIADQVGVDRSSVSNHLRLLELDETTMDAVRQGRLSLGHAKVLLAVTDATARASLAGIAMRQGLTVRQLEARIKSATGNGGGGTRQRAATERSSNLRDLERQLGEHLGTKVSIQSGRSKGSGKLVIDFYDLDQFDGVLQRLGFAGGR